MQSRISLLADVTAGLSVSVLSYVVYQAVSGPSGRVLRYPVQEKHVQRVREIARDDLGMSHDQAQGVGVHLSSNPNGMSGGCRLLGNQWVSLPLTSQAAQKGDFEEICQKVRFSGKQLDTGCAAVRCGLLYSNARRDFVVAHELAHLVCDHASLAGAFPAGALVSYQASRLILPPGPLRLASAIVCSASAFYCLQLYSLKCEFEADAIAAAANPALARGGLLHFEASVAFNKHLLRSFPEAAYDGEGEALNSLTHPSFKDRVTRLEAILASHS